MGALRSPGRLIQFHRINQMIILKRHTSRRCKPPMPITCTSQSTVPTIFLRHVVLNTPSNVNIFYDAEGMRRNLRDVIENGEQEFDALKVDLYDGICDTCASDYADGLLRMRATLSQAAGFPLSGSVIAQFPSMIKAAEKKGLCHMLVNDHMLEWVHENE